jgi:hypothetical protein
MPRRLLYIRYKRWQGVYSASAPLHQLDTEPRKYGGIVMEAAYIVSQSVLKEAIKEAIKESVEDGIIDSSSNRFAGVYLSPEEVAKIHGVNKLTVISYIKDGLIEAEQEKKYGSYSIRLSDAIQIDFKELRKKLKLR